MEIVKEFGISPILLLAQIVNFAILLFLLKKFLYKPILKTLDDRKTKIAKSLKEADEIEKRMQTVSEEQIKILDIAKLEASKIVSEAKEEAKELTEKSLTKTKETMNEMLEKNRERLSLEKEQMLKDAKKELTELVLLATAAVAKEKVSKESDSKIVQEAINSLVKK